MEEMLLSPTLVECLAVGKAGTGDFYFAWSDFANLRRFRDVSNFVFRQKKILI